MANQLNLDYGDPYFLTLDPAGTISITRKSDNVTHYLPFSKSIVWLFLLSQDPSNSGTLCQQLFDTNTSTTAP